MAAPSLSLVGAAVALAAGACLASATSVAADADRGKAVYSRCAACHALAYDRTGPRHCGLFGRRAGSVAGFEYSPAMKQSGIVWTAISFDRFLADPQRTVPGTSMGYAGIKDAEERADLIAFLERANESAECRGAAETAGPAGAVGASSTAGTTSTAGAPSTAGARSTAGTSGTTSR